MSLEVLQTNEDVERARVRLEERGLSCVGMEFGEPGVLSRLLKRRGPDRIGDRLKSWDVLRTAEFIELSFPKTARVLDIGAYSSEILCVLHRLGFERPTGIDLNPGIRRMPYPEAIRYEVGNFLRTPFPDGAFDVVTSISVIEHGFDAPALLREMSRLLAPGGCFIASFDYWPDKIDTTGTKFFGMDWRIFSREEVRQLVDFARGFGLIPPGSLSFEARERPVRCAAREYTFAWLVLRKG